MGGYRLYIYIATILEKKINSNASQGEVSPGRGFSCADNSIGNGAWKSFGVSVLKCIFSGFLSIVFLVTIDAVYLEDIDGILPWELSGNIYTIVNLPGTLVHMETIILRHFPKRFPSPIFSIIVPTRKPSSRGNFPLLGILLLFLHSILAIYILPISSHGSFLVV